MRCKRIRDLVDARKKVDEVINESPMRWFGHMKRMDGNGMAKSVVGSELTGLA